MRKWDIISWFATAIVTLGVVAAASTGNGYFMLLAVLAYFLRPTLHAFGLFSRLTDERELSIGYRSGNIALMAVIATAALLAMMRASEGQHTDDLNAVIIVGIVARALSGILLSRSYLDTGVKISVTLGLAIGAFGLLEGGVTLESLQHVLPGLFFIILAFVGRRFPMVGAGVYALLALGLFLLISFFLRSTFSVYQLVTGLLIGVPLGAVAYCFYRGGRPGTLANTSE